MSKVKVEYDTDTKEMNVTNDGEILDGVKHVQFFKGLKQNGKEEDGHSMHMHRQVQEKDDEGNGTHEYHVMMANMHLEAAKASVEDKTKEKAEKDKKIMDQVSKYLSDLNTPRYLRERLANQKKK